MYNTDKRIAKKTYSNSISKDTNIRRILPWHGILPQEGEILYYIPDLKSTGDVAFLDTLLSLDRDRDRYYENPYVLYCICLKMIQMKQ